MSVARLRRIVAGLGAIAVAGAVSTAAGCSGSAARTGPGPVASSGSGGGSPAGSSKGAPAAVSAGVSVVRLDGPVYGRPADGGTAVFAATENNTVYALSPTGGSVMWSKHLAEPFRPHGCGNIVPLGITGAPVYDPESQVVYVVAEDSAAKHVLYGLAAADGHVVWHVDVDPPVGDRAFLQQRPALTLWHGHVFAVFGGLAGDCGDYTGAVASVDIASGSVNWFEASTSGRGGMWAPGEPAIGDDRLYFSVGNGNADQASDPFDGSDSVVALDENAKKVDLFAPATWAADNANDADLGSMNPALAAGRVVIAGKSGQGYLLDPEHLGGVTASARTFPACAAFGAAAVDADVVYLPCADGTRAFRISDKPTALWHAAKANGQPVLNGGRIWVTDWDDGALLALNPATGAADRAMTVGTLPHFATPTVVGSKVFLGTMDGVAVVSP